MYAKEVGLQGLTVDTLRSLFREMNNWREAYERDVSLQTLHHDGVEWNLLDVERLYEVSQQVLTRRQREAIKLFLVGNLREVEVAIIMGIKPNNPVGQYATDGLRRLVEMVESRELTFFV